MKKYKHLRPRSESFDSVMQNGWSILRQSKDAETMSEVSPAEGEADESNGADERTRTSTSLRIHASEACASTNSATSA